MKVAIDAIGSRNNRLSCVAPCLRCAVLCCLGQGFSRTSHGVTLGTFSFRSRCCHVFHRDPRWQCRGSASPWRGATASDSSESTVQASNRTLTQAKNPHMWTKCLGSKTRTIRERRAAVPCIGDVIFCASSAIEFHHVNMFCGVGVLQVFTLPRRKSLHFFFVFHDCRETKLQISFCRSGPCGCVCFVCRLTRKKHNARHSLRRHLSHSWEGIHRRPRHSHGAGDCRHKKRFPLLYWCF